MPPRVVKLLTNSDHCPGAGFFIVKDICNWWYNPDNISCDPLLICKMCTLYDRLANMWTDSVDIFMCGLLIRPLCLLKALHQ